MVAMPFEGPARARTYGSGHSETLVDSWDGRTWSIEASPNKGLASEHGSFTGATHDLLNGVSCSSPRSCAAVGVYVDANGDEQGLA
jgi:hypothetical protein